MAPQCHFVIGGHAATVAHPPVRNPLLTRDYVLFWDNSDCLGVFLLVKQTLPSFCCACGVIWLHTSEGIGWEAPSVLGVGPWESSLPILLLLLDLRSPGPLTSLMLVLRPICAFHRSFVINSPVGPSFQLVLEAFSRA